MVSLTECTNIIVMQVCCNSTMDRQLCVLYATLRHLVDYHSSVSCRSTYGTNTSTLTAIDGNHCKRMSYYNKQHVHAGHC